MPLRPLALGPLENWSDFRLQLAWAYRGTPKPLHQCGVYLPHPTTAWLLYRGQVRLKFKAGEEVHKAGNWIFPRAETGHQEFSRDVEFLSIRFTAEWPTGESLFDRSRSRSIPAAEVKDLTRLSEQLVDHVGQEFPGIGIELRRMPGSPRRYFQFQRLLYGWMLAYLSAMESLGLVPQTIERLDERVREAVHFMEVRALNLRLREGELAQRTGLSVSQLNKLFVRELGMTPAEYWDSKRIKMARLVLLNSERSIKSIAFDLGFGSLPHFSAWVKRKLGQSPRKLRSRRN